MSRQRKLHKYNDSSSFSTLDTIRNICDDVSVRPSLKSNSHAIKTIREVCDDFDLKSDTRSDTNAINAIREVCDDFVVHSETRNSPSTINAIREICDGFVFQVETRSSSSPINAIRNVDCRKGKNDCPPSSSDNQSSSNCPPRRHKQRHCDISDSSAREDINALCGGNYVDRCYKSSRPQENCYRPCERYDPGNSYFNSVITPVTGLTPQYSGVTGTVEFRMRRKNKTVTLQWEPFSGTMAASGVAYLTVMQSIWNTPPYPMSWPIMIRYKDVNRMTNLTIDPSSTTGNIRFYLNTDGTATNINMGDAFYVYASSISWIVD